jgi:hypothetical protein
VDAIEMPVGYAVALLTNLPEPCPPVRTPCGPSVTTMDDRFNRSLGIVAQLFFPDNRATFSGKVICPNKFSTSSEYKFCIIDHSPLMKPDIYKIL